MQRRRVSWPIQGRIASSSRSSLEVLVRAGEDLLEDLLGVLRPEPEGLAADGVDVAREARDELAPGVLVTAAAAGDELSIGERCKLHGKEYETEMFGSREDPGPVRRPVDGERRPTCCTLRLIWTSSGTRHSELLQSARTGELATRLAAARREERRTFLARMRSRREPSRTSTPAAST